MTEKDIRPVGPRCLVKVYESASQSASGLFLDNTSNASAAPVMGTVLAAGEESNFKQGDEVLFRRYSVDVLKIITEQGEQTIHLIEDEDILATVVLSE